MDKGKKILLMLFASGESTSIEMVVMEKSVSIESHFLQSYHC